MSSTTRATEVAGEAAILRAWFLHRSPGLAKWEYLRPFAENGPYGLVGNDGAWPRAYPGRDDSLGVSLRAQGRDAVLKSLDAWQIKSIYATIVE